MIIVRLVCSALCILFASLASQSAHEGNPDVYYTIALTVLAAAFAIFAVVPTGKS